MALPLDELVTEVTYDQARAKTFEVLKSLGFPTTSWHSGAIIRTIVALVAWLLQATMATVVLIARSGLLDYATGDWLTLLAEQVYGYTRRAATFATGRVRIDNTLGNSYGPYQPFEVKVYDPTTKRSFYIIDTWEIGPEETDLFVNVQAVESGSASTAAAAGISAFENPLNGVTVTNEAAVVGLDAETDPEVRAQCRAKLGALSPNGPKLAYEYVAKAVALNGGVVVNRVKVVGDTGTGELSMYVAGPSGALSSGDRTSVESGILRWATPQCVEPTVSNVTEQEVNIVQTVYIVDAENLVDSEIQASCSARLNAWAPTLPIEAYGGELHPGVIQAESARAVPGYRVAVTTPASPVAVTTGQVIKLGTITTNVVRVAA